MTFVLKKSCFHLIDIQGSYAALYAIMITIFLLRLEELSLVNIFMGILIKFMFIYAYSLTGYASFNSRQFTVTSLHVKILATSGAMSFRIEMLIRLIASEHLQI